MRSDVYATVERKTEKVSFQRRFEGRREPLLMKVVSSRQMELSIGRHAMTSKVYALTILVSSN